jgi:hypothetical protein
MRLHGLLAALGTCQWGIFPIAPIAPLGFINLSAPGWGIFPNILSNGFVVGPKGFPDGAIAGGRRGFAL